MWLASWVFFGAAGVVGRRTWTATTSLTRSLQLSNRPGPVRIGPLEWNWLTWAGCQASLRSVVKVSL
jgi:hypothetical protein